MAAPCAPSGSGISFALFGLLTLLWIYLPATMVNFFAMMCGRGLPKYGIGPWPIDRGHVARDGNRLLGDGKTWVGLVGGSILCGVVALIQYVAVDPTRCTWPLVGHLATLEDGHWALAMPGWLAALIFGTCIGLFALIGDMSGSFLKRRKGHAREGSESSKDLLLDSLPFAVVGFALTLLLLSNTVIGAWGWWPWMLGIIICTPPLHRGFNILGYKLGWKDVPY